MLGWLKRISREYDAELAVLIGLVSIVISCVVSVSVQYWEITVENPGIDPFAGLKKAIQAVYQSVVNWPRLVWILLPLGILGLLAVRLYRSRRKSDEIIGRDEEIRTLLRLIKSRHRERVLLVSGPGGVGKSLLLDVFAQVCGSRGVRWAKIDFRDGFIGRSDVLNLIVAQLEGEGEFEGFRAHYNDYVSRMSEEGETTYRDQTTLRELEEQLLEALVHDLEGLARTSCWSNRVVLFFDTTDQLVGTRLGFWLQNALVPALMFTHKRRSGVLVVLSGRDAIDLDDAFESRQCCRDLRAFSPAMVREYLIKTLGWTEDAITSRVYELTDGHPLNVGILVDLLQLMRDQKAVAGALNRVSARIGMGAVRERVTRTLIDELTREMIDSGVPDLAALVRRCAIPRWFNVDHITSLHEGWSSDESYLEVEKLKRLSFIKPRSLGGYVYHEMVRNAILSKCKADSPEDLRTMHQHWSEFYRANESSLDHWDARRRNRVEIIYHLLRYDESSGVALFAREIEDLDSFREMAYFSVLAEELRATELRPTNRLWLDYYEGYQILFSGDWILASAKFREILSHPQIPPELRSVTAYELGKVLAVQGDNSGAEELYSEALKIEREEGDWRRVSLILLRLGQVCRWVGRWQDAIRAFSEALETAEMIGDRFIAGWILTNLGVSYLLKGDLERAKDTYEQSLASQRALGNLDGIGRSLRYLGGLYLALGRLDDAERTLLESMEMLENSAQRYTLARVQIDLALIDVERKETESAGTHLEKADEIIQEMDATPLLPALQAARARYFRAILRPEEALRVLKECQEAIAAENLFGHAIYRKALADTLVELGRYDEAQSCYRESISRLRQLGSSYHLCLSLISQCEVEFKESGPNVGEDYYKLLDEAKALTVSYKYRDVEARIHRLEGHMHTRHGSMDAATRSYSAAYAAAERFNEALAKDMLDEIMSELKTQMTSQAVLTQTDTGCST